MLHKHKGSFVSQGDLLRYLIKDEELSDKLADCLEMQVDGGESAGAFLRDVCQSLLDDNKRAYAHRLLAEVNHD